MSNAVSVVIPNYNRGHLIGSAIESALAQDGAELEVLVCDDGSTDDSERVVKAFSDPRVRWLPGDRSGGPIVPRNRGIAAARGEWVAFLDSDDSWCEGKLDAQLRLLRETDAVASSTNAYRCVPGDTRPPRVLYTHLPRPITLSDQLSANWVVTSSVVVATAEVRRVGGFPLATARRIFEDYALWLRLAQSGPIQALDEPLVNYRDEAAASHRGSMAAELVCAANTFRDFGRWRRSQERPLATSMSERLAVARQLGRLVSVRDIVARAAAGGRRRTGPA